MSLWVFFVLLASCFAAGATGALFPPGPWYERLQKPSWVPPNWMFPVVWTTLYFLMAFAGARVAGLEGSGLAMALWSLQIAFNTLWTPVFFGLRRLSGALPVMAGLWCSVLATTIALWQLDIYAGLAFLPYLIWVSVAAALNVAMVRLNPDVVALKPDQLA
jgi:Tryptophan-rich sensory protein (mitochondrial benzodiazepine receptor homolog)